jgi:adenylosuccinate synthase
VLLSGPTCSGKTTLANRLQEVRSATLIRARDVIAEASGLGATPSRSELVSAGAALDVSSKGRWLAEGSLHRIANSMSSDPVLIDAARSLAQARHVLDVFEEVVVFHLTATIEVRQHRYERQADSSQRLPSFNELALQASEAGAESVRAIADLVLDTTFLRPDEVMGEALEHLP